MEKVGVTNEKSMMRYLERNEYKEGDVVYSQIQYQKLTLRNHASIEELKKETKHKKLRNMILKE